MVIIAHYDVICQLVEMHFCGLFLREMQKALPFGSACSFAMIIRIPHQAACHGWL